MSYDSNIIPSDLHILSQIPCGIFQFSDDPSFTFTYKSPVFQEFSGNVSSVNQFCSKEDFNRLRQCVTGADQDGLSFFQLQLTFNLPAGKHICYLRGRRDQGSGEISCIVFDNPGDFSALESTPCLPDPATGTYSRRCAITKIDSFIHSNPETYSAFLLIELTYSNQQNPPYDFESIEFFLEQITQSLKSLVASEDIICRLNSEEIIMFLKNPGDDRAILTLLTALQDSLMQPYVQGLTVSYSIGVATTPRAGKSFKSLYRNAENAVFEAGKRGINQFIFFKPGFSPFREPGMEAGGGKSEMDLLSPYSPSAKLKTTYHELMEFNVTNDYYKIILHLEEKYVTLPEHGCLSKNLAQMGREMIHSEDTKRFSSFFDFHQIREQLKNGLENLCGEFRRLCIDGDYRWISLQLSPLKNNMGEEFYLCAISDIDEKKRSMENDIVTGYPNFNRFRDHVINRLRLPLKPGEHYALTYADLKNFKFINDIYGYDSGDYILKYWADTIYLDLDSGEYFARSSSDHFVALYRYQDLEELKERIQRIMDQMHHCSKPAGGHFPLEISVGIYCLTSRRQLRLDDMLDRANLAQRSAKNQSGSHYCVYTETMRKKVLKERLIESEMRDALKNREFCIYLQTMVDIQNGNKTIGAEVLVRWLHPENGVMLPSSYVPLFEKNGFIVPIDRFVYEEACRYLSIRLSENKAPFILSVNVSRTSVFQSDFIEYYCNLKAQYSIPDYMLELECTESTAVNDPAALNKIMSTMRKRGFLFSMDDFGSGYSSLNLLKDITVDVLKLDMGFFSNGFRKKRDRAIVSSIITMAGNLNMKVVAEGIETPEQLAILKELGCDYVQGYVFSKPVPVKEI